MGEGKPQQAVAGGPTSRARRTRRRLVARTALTLVQLACACVGASYSALRGPLQRLAATSSAQIGGTGNVLGIGGNKVDPPGVREERAARRAVRAGRAAYARAAVGAYGSISAAGLRSADEYVRSLGGTAVAARVRLDRAGGLHFTLLPSSAESANPSAHIFASFLTFRLLPHLSELLGSAEGAQLQPIDFHVSLVDEPVVCPERLADRGQPPGAPVLAWDGPAECSRQVLFPAADLVWQNQDWSEGSRWRFDAAPQVAWEAKRDLILFRGTLYGPQRHALKALTHGCTEHTEMVDCALYEYTDGGGGSGTEASFLNTTQQSAYKYFLDLQGTVSTLRLKNLLLSDSVVFVAASAHRQFFTHELQPWVHYIPVAADLSDLLERVRWAREHDAECRVIAQRATAYVRAHLRPADLRAYQVRGCVPACARSLTPGSG